MIEKQASKDKEGEAYQRMTWDALKKSINGLVNKVSVFFVSLLGQLIPPGFSTEHC